MVSWVVRIKGINMGKGRTMSGTQYMFNKWQLFYSIVLVCTSELRGPCCFVGEELRLRDCYVTWPKLHQSLADPVHLTRLIILLGALFCKLHEQREFVLFCFVF